MGKALCGKKLHSAIIISKDFEDPKFRKSMMFLSRGVTKTDVETLKVNINSLSHSAFDSK